VAACPISSFANQLRVADAFAAGLKRFDKASIVSSSVTVILGGGSFSGTEIEELNLDDATGEGFAWLSFFTYSISAVAKLRDHISGREIELLQQRGVSRVVVQALQ
jgi:hypothetical protein